MILWIVCLAALALTTSKCEPPVNSYLPPNSESGSGGQPSSQYATPGGVQGSLGGFNPASPSFGGQPRDSYNSAGINPSSPSAEYGVPEQGSGGFLRGGSRGSQATGQGFTPSSQYGSPNQRGSNGGSSGPFRGRGSSQKPESSYGTPSNEYQSPGDTGFNGANSGQGSRQLGGSPSSSYGTPDFGNQLSNKDQNYRESGVNESNEPAKYEFSYDVDDPDTGTKFGHSEQRDGDVTTGEYNVVLPDGRKQVVEYEADHEGYKPQIRYEGTRSGFRTGSGFGRGAQGRNQGYNGAGANADAFAESGAGYPSGNEPQDRRYQQPGFGQGSGRTGYSGGKPDGQRFDGQGQAYSGGSSGYPGSGPQTGGNYPGNQGDGGYSIGVQGRGGQRGGGRGASGFGGENGYPSGGPNGPRGSGY